MQAYAAAYPEETAGVVAINPVPAWQAWSTLGFKEMTPKNGRARPTTTRGLITNRWTTEK